MNIMFLNKVILQIIFFLHCVIFCLAAVRINFARCALNGFTCVTNANKKTDVRYECPKGVNDVLFYLNIFVAPATIEKLVIINCENLTLSTRCSGENKPIQYLQVANIRNLIFLRTQYESMVPPTVVFENISNIETIPSRTFAQVEKSYHSAGCVIPKVDFESLYFKNVSIGTVKSNAFIGLEQFKKFSFIDVNIKRIESLAIQTKMPIAGEFEVKSSNIEIIEHLGIQVYSKKVFFSESKFTEISSSGINGTIEDFYFTNNTIETVHPNGFSILATNIFILDNTFLLLKSGAFEKLSPGLIQDSGRNFGKLRFVYDFSKNSLNFVEAGSLNPDYVAYENVQTEMMFSRNKLLCTCENLGWLFSYLGHGPNSVQLETFYEMVIDESYTNVCDQPCDLPIKRIEKMIQCGKCMKNVTLAKLCVKNERSTVIDKTTTRRLFNSTVSPGATFAQPGELNFENISEIWSVSNIKRINKMFVLSSFAILYILTL